MKEVEMTTKIPSTMTMTINAIWNKETETWEVSILEIGTVSKEGLVSEPLYYQKTSDIDICDECDEYVIPIAIMEHYGIDTTKIRFVEVE